MNNQINPNLNNNSQSNNLNKDINIYTNSNEMNNNNFNSNNKINNHIEGSNNSQNNSINNNMNLNENSDNNIINNHINNNSIKNNNINNQNNDEIMMNNIGNNNQNNNIMNSNNFSGNSNNNTLENNNLMITNNNSNLQNNKEIFNPFIQQNIIQNNNIAANNDNINNNIQNNNIINNLSSQSIPQNISSSTSSQQQTQPQLKYPLDYISSETYTQEDILETKYIENILRNDYNLFESEEESKLREEILNSLGTCVKNAVYKMAIELNYPEDSAQEAGGKIFTFGSYRLGIVGPGDDIDVLCVGPDFCERDKFYKKMVEELEKEKKITQIFKVDSAYVPIIKIVFNNIPIDILVARLSKSQIGKNLTSLEDDSILKNCDE
jgi:poly(A) polymerase